VAKTLRLAITADLHWGINQLGDAATEGLLAFLQGQPPDVLVLAGDVGAGPHFDQCLALFSGLPCRKALVPGNHDIWVQEKDPRGDSLQVYEEYLPALCARFGFDYLDSGPMWFPEADLALVGSINWYDYSWSIDQLRQQVPDWEVRLKTKVFSRGRHNDARFVRWPLDDGSFTARVVAALDQHLQEALRRVGHAIVITHHPAFAGLSFPYSGPPTPDGLLWYAFSGNRQLEAVLERDAQRIPFVFCGHTHRERENQLGAIRGINIGGDYHFKRMILLDWPERRLEPHTFGDPEGRG
jgi:3',5'-cyclic AMP phosphodiesterase CpdA